MLSASEWTRFNLCQGPDGSTGPVGSTGPTGPSNFNLLGINNYTIADGASQSFGPYPTSSCILMIFNGGSNFTSGHAILYNAPAPISGFIGGTTTTNTSDITKHVEVTGSSSNIELNNYTGASVTFDVLISRID
jgi:hypothetical protein